MRTEPLIIYHNTKPLCRAEKWTFYDKVQSVGGQYVSTTIKSPVPIAFSIGDYCEYRGERYYMNNLPSVTQQAKPKEYGEGFVYDNVRFDGAGFELCRILMLDITPTTGLYIPKKGTNYTGSSNFQLYCAETCLTVDGTERIYPAVCTLAGKIQANLDRAYPTSGWKILVDTTTTHEVKGNTELRTHTDDKILSFNNTTVANALAEVNNTFKLNFHIKGRTIYIGYTLGAVTGNFMGDSGVVGDNDYYYLGYGRGYADKEHPGRGLYEIKKSSDANQQIITRLRAMGSTKNMPFRYYNKRYDLSQDLYPSNLQLPDTFKSPQEKQAGHQRRKTINKSVYEVLGETNDAYLDKYNDIKKCKEGLREGVAIWDGSNGLPEIYPTIERMIYGELRGNDCADMLGKTESGGGAQVNGHSSFYYYDNNERVDEILAVGKAQGSDTTDDANFGNGLLRPDTLEGSGKIDCPCEINQHFTIPHQVTNVDRKYVLFPPIRLQPKGKYILTPVSTGLRAELAVNTGRHESAGKHVNCTFYYEIILEKVSLRDNKKKEIGRYKSKEIQVSSGTYEKPGGFIDLPNIPDLFDDKKEEGKKRDAQIKEIYLESVSDVYASIIYHIDNVHTDVKDDTYVTIHVGKSSYGNEATVMKDTPSVYVWSPSTEDKKDINKPFHVIIKDIGISQFVSQFSGGEQPMLSMKDGNCLGRNFLIGKDVKRVTYTKNGNTYNGWQLELTRATDDSIHRYYPNQTDRLQAGDHYVLLGIPMPDAYVQAAEMRLLVAASQYLRDNSRTKYNYEPKVDELFLARNYDRCESMNAKEQSIYWNLYAGLRLPFFGSPNTDNADEELPLVNIPIESLTIKEGDGIIPKVELHLREGNSQSTIQQINAKVDALYDGMNRGNGGMSLSDTNTAIFRTGVKYFLRKDIADTAEQVIIFLKGIIAKAISYFNGIVNNGDIRNKGDITNSGNIMTNNLTVTGKATFFELEIQKAKAAGGMTVNSAGSFHIDAVEETPEGFVCYQRAEKDGVTLLQTCEPKDQMMCSNGMNSLPIQGRGDQTNDGKPHAIGNHYYWRLVTDAPKQVVTHTIDGKEEKCLKLVLSKTDHSENTIDIPQVGDDLVQVGNRDNKERQSVMMSCAYNSFDPELKPSYWAHYVGVNDYDISKHRYTWFAANGSQVTGNFKVQSDNGGLESIEDYMKGLATNTYKLVMSGSQFNVKADGSLSPQFISIYAYKVQGENLTQLSPSNNVKVLVTKGENKVPLLNDNKESLAVRSDRWNLWADKDNMPDVFNVELFIKDKLVDKQKLVDMQKIHVVRDGRNGQDAKVWHVAFSIRNITGKKGETFKLKYGRTVGESTSWYDDSPTNHGFNQLYAVIIDDATGNKHQADLGADLNVADFFTGGSMTVRLMNRKTGETLAQDTIYAEAKDGKPGKDAVSYKLIPSKEKAVAYIDSQTPRKKVKVEVGYFIQKTVGDVTTTESLYSEGLTLRAYPALGDLKGSSGTYGFGPVTRKYDSSEDIFSVTLLKGNKILDKRTIPLVMKPKVVFDIDTVNGEIRSEIKTVDGNVNSFKATIDETSNTVGNLQKEYSQLKIESNKISLTVNNGTRPNLLWGSDLDLSEVQDVIKKANGWGNSIKEETEKKAEWKRKRDNADSDDDRMRYQEGMDDCDRKIAQAQGEVAKCREAIAKHLGVVISGDMEIGKRDMFEYLKGEGVGGSDAIRFKNAYKREDWAKWTSISWHDVPLKPNTQYTISVWVKFKSYGGKGRMYVDCASDDGRYCFGGYRYKEHYYDRADIDEWQRVRYVFDSGASKRLSSLFFACIADEEEGAQCEIWLCRPKLEEGNTATPWCAYDVTADAVEQITSIFIKDNKIQLNARNTEVSGDLSVGSLKTTPKVTGDPFIEAHDGEFNIFTFERKKGIELSVDDSGMPHLIFYDKDGNPAYDLGWTGMKQLIDDVVQEYWSADFLMKEDSYTDATRISNITRDKCKEYYTYHAAYYRKTGTYGSNEEYNKVTFVEKSFRGQRIVDGWYYPVNNGSLARVANESAYIYGTQKFQYRNGKMIGYENVFIEKDTENGPWRFSDYKSGGGRRGGGSRSRGSESSAPSQP